MKTWNPKILLKYFWTSLFALDLLFYKSALVLLYSGAAMVLYL